MRGLGYTKRKEKSRREPVHSLKQSRRKQSGGGSGESEIKKRKKFLGEV